MSNTNSYSRRYYIFASIHVCLSIVTIDLQYSTNTLILSSMSNNGDMICLNISITDDDRVEYDETFSITLTVDNPLDTINGNNTTLVNVTIVDNDGMVR